MAFHCPGRSPLSYSAPRYFTALRSRAATPTVTEVALTPRTGPCWAATPVAARAPGEGEPFEPAAAPPLPAALAVPAPGPVPPAAAPTASVPVPGAALATAPLAPRPADRTSTVVPPIRPVRPAAAIPRPRTSPTEIPTSGPGVRPPAKRSTTRGTGVMVWPRPRPAHRSVGSPARRCRGRRPPPSGRRAGRGGRLRRSPCPRRGRTGGRPGP